LKRYFINVKSKCLTKTLSEYPFNLPLFKMEFVDLSMLLSEDIFKSFCSAYKTKINYPHLEILNLSEERAEKVKKVLSKHLKGGNK